MIKPQDIDTKELENRIVCKIANPDNQREYLNCYTEVIIQQFLSDKLNRIENEIDYWNLALSISVDKKELIQLKQIIRKEFTK